MYDSLLNMEMDGALICMITVAKQNFLQTEHLKTFYFPISNYKIEDFA